MRYKRNNKLLGLIMAFLLVLGPASLYPAGAFMYEQQALELHNLGLINGTETSVFNPDLAAAVDRETGVVMMLRLLGLEEVARAMPAEEVEATLARFSDAADISGWARSSVAYAVANGLITGLPDNSFGPHLPLTGNAYSTLILRQLGLQPDYHSGAVQLSQMGVLTVQQMEGLGVQELDKDKLVGISYGVLLITRPSLLPPPSLPRVSITGPDSAEAIAGDSSQIEFVLSPITQVDVTYSMADQSVADIISCEKQDNGVCTLIFTAKKPGTTTLTLVGSSPGYTAAVRKIAVRVKGTASINGLGSEQQVATGECSLPFQVTAPEGARVSAASSDSSVLDDIAVTGYGEDRFLKFNARQPGQSTVTVSIKDGDDILVSRQMIVTVVGRPVITGLDGIIEVKAGECSLPFSVQPAGAVVEYLDCNSSNLRDVSLDYDETSGSGSLDFWAGSPGTAVITLQASKVGYEVLTQYVQIEVLAPAVGDSGSPTPAITLGGLEDVVVSGASLQYLPFTVDPADAVITVTSQNNPAVVSGASIISVLSSSDSPARLLCFELDGNGGEEAQITVAAFKPGYTGASQTIIVSVTNDPVNHVDFEVSNYTKNSIATGASFEVTLQPNDAVPSVYYANEPGKTVISSVSIINDVLPARNLSFWVNEWGIAEIYLVGRFGNQLDSGKSTVTVEP